MVIRELLAGAWNHNKGREFGLHEKNVLTVELEGRVLRQETTHGAVKETGENC